MLNFWANDNRQIGLLTLAKLDLDHYPLDERVTRISLDIIWPSRNRWDGLRSNLQRMQMIRASVKQYAPDIVISFIDRTNILVLAALFGTGVPVVISERVDPRDYRIDRVRQLARRCLYPFARLLVIQTQAVTSWARAVMMSNRVVVLANPVERLPSPTPYSARDLQVVAIGRLTHQKGFDILIRAFAKSQLQAGGWELKILGEGTERQQLQSLIDELNLAERVSLVGVVENPQHWLNKARIFALPSRFEGFPNALLEAMAMGCACIATDCRSGPGEIIENGENGTLIPVDDVDALTAALNKLEQNQSLSVQFSERALAVRERFAIEKIMSEWDALIQKEASA